MPGFQNLFSLHRLTAVFKPSSEDREITLLHPNLVKFLTGLRFGTNGANNYVKYDYLGAFCMAPGGYILQIPSMGAYRSYPEQDILFAIGRGENGQDQQDQSKIVTNASAGESFHNHFCAVDIKIIQLPDNVSEHDVMINSGIVAFAKSLNIRWGGDFVVKGKKWDDYNHFETFRLPHNTYVGTKSGWWNDDLRIDQKTPIETIRTLPDTVSNIGKKYFCRLSLL